MGIIDFIIKVILILCNVSIILQFIIQQRALYLIIQPNSFFFWSFKH